MGEKKPNPVTINEKEYDFNDLTQEQQQLFQHCVDLDRKIGSAQFNLDQLAVGKQAFIKMLEDSLSAKSGEVFDVNPQVVL
jgi:hypothetical protein